MSTTNSPLNEQDQQETSDDMPLVTNGKQEVKAVVTADRNKYDLQRQQKPKHINDMHENVTSRNIINSTLSFSSTPNIEKKQQQRQQRPQHHYHHHYHYYNHQHHHHHYYYHNSKKEITPSFPSTSSASTTAAITTSNSTSNLSYNKQQLSLSAQQQRPKERNTPNNLMPILPTKILDLFTLPSILVKDSAVIINNNSEESLIVNDDFEITRTKVTDITRNMQKYHINELVLNTKEEPPIIITSFGTTNSNNRPLSPLSILCPTTNSLIQTKLLLEEETTPTTLIGSIIDDEQVEEVEDEEENEEWKVNFLKLMSRVITYSENLESISIELLRTEGKVRELILLQKSLVEQFDEKEKLFNNRLSEYQDISRQQVTLIDQLAELDQDLDLTAKKNNRRSVITNNTATTTATNHTNYGWQQSSEYNQHQRGESSNSIYSSTSKTTIDSRYFQQQQHYPANHADSMKDIVHKIRYEVGLRIGGGIGTGHVIHSFQSPLNNGLELIIAGSGTISSSISSLLEQDQEEETFSSSIQSPSIKYLGFHRHNYMIHINHQDRKSRFKILPKNLWTPDNQVDQCQFKTCTTIFNFYQRRHHCRRCGQVICQRHSLNRLPLFSATSVADSTIDNWYRVCDTCFYDLIIVGSSKK